MIETSFIEGKQYREDELGEMAVQKANWRYIAFGATGLSILLTLALIHSHLLPKLQPYYIQINVADGATRILGFAPTSVTVPEAAEAKQLRDFVTVMLSVSSDKEQMRRSWRKLYAQATKNGKRLLNQVEALRKPFEQKDGVTIDILRTLKTGEHTYDLRWRETRYSSQIEIQHYSGVFIAKHEQPQTQEEIDQNPLGIFLDTWSIAKE
jgi:type IV secretory pathway TrbF-like protein